MRGLMIGCALLLAVPANAEPAEGVPPEAKLVSKGYADIKHDTSKTILDARLEKNPPKGTFFLSCSPDVEPNEARYQFVYVWARYKGESENRETNCHDTDSGPTIFTISRQGIETITFHYSGAGEDHAKVTWELWFEASGD